MPWNTTFEKESGFIVIAYSGKLTAQELEAEERHSIDLALKKNTRRFLVDMLDYEGSVSSLEISQSPGRYGEKLTRRIRIAVVEPRSKAAKADVEFYELVCRNRAWNVRTFESREDAAAWLSREAERTELGVE